MGVGGEHIDKVVDRTLKDKGEEDVPRAGLDGASLVACSCAYDYGCDKLEDLLLLMLGEGDEDDRHR